MFVPVRSHLGVHDAEQMEQLMQEPTLVLSPACSLVRHLVGTFEDEFLVLRRRLCLCVDWGSRSLFKHKKYYPMHHVPVVDIC